LKTIEQKRAYQRIYQRAKVARLNAAGLCLRCSEPSAEGQVCVPCRIFAKEKWNVR
jgi:hypothetical protein